jgi:hypothetical protein
LLLERRDEMDPNLKRAIIVFKRISERLLLEAVANGSDSNLL